MTSGDAPPSGTVPLGLRGEHVPVGAHIAYLWETPQEFRHAAGFLQEGLRRGDCGVIFGHEEGNRHVCELLEALGHDVPRLMALSNLVLVNGQASAGRMLEQLGDVFTAALDRGAPLIRLLGNIGWGHPGWPDERDLMAFEARVTDAAKQFPCVVVCMYDVSRLAGRVMLHGAFETHPLTFCRNVIRENPHYVHADAFLADLRAEAS